MTERRVEKNVSLSSAAKDLGLGGGLIWPKGMEVKEKSKSSAMPQSLGQPRSCSTFQEQERAREEGAKEMSGEELLEERWRRVAEEMNQLNISSPRGSEVPLMAIEVLQNEEISGLTRRVEKRRCKPVDLHHLGAM